MYRRYSGYKSERKYIFENSTRAFNILFLISFFRTCLLFRHNGKRDCKDRTNSTMLRQRKVVRACYLIFFSFATLCPVCPPVARLLISNISLSRENVFFYLIAIVVYRRFYFPTLTPRGRIQHAHILAPGALPSSAIFFVVPPRNAMHSR